MKVKLNNFFSFSKNLLGYCCYFLKYFKKINFLSFFFFYCVILTYFCGKQLRVRTRLNFFFKHYNKNFFFSIIVVQTKKYL